MNYVQSESNASGKKRNRGESIETDHTNSHLDHLMSLQRMLVKRIQREQAIGQTASKQMDIAAAATNFGFSSVAINKIPINKIQGKTEDNSSSKDLARDIASILDAPFNGFVVKVNESSKEEDDTSSIDTYPLESETVNKHDLDFWLQGIAPDPIRHSFAHNESYEYTSVKGDSISSNTTEEGTADSACNGIRSGKIAFEKAANQSLHSQLNLQRWDRWMGLRRNHSKTMTQTTQSRMILRTFVEGKCLDTQIHMDFY